MFEKYIFIGHKSIVDQVRYLFLDVFEETIRYHYSPNFHINDLDTDRDDIYVICSFDDIQVSMEYGKHIFLSEIIKVFDSIDSIYLKNIDRPITILSTSHLHQTVLEINASLEYHTIIDNLPNLVTYIENNKKSKPYFFIISDNMMFQNYLESINLTLGVDYHVHTHHDVKPSEYIQRTLQANQYYHLSCHYGSMTMDLRTNGDLVSCHSFLEFPHGNILSNQIQNIFDCSIYTKIIKLSMMNKSYIFCSDECLMKCAQSPIIKQESHLLSYDTPNLSYENIRLGIGFDATCNLCCPSCRNSLSNNEKTLIKDSIYKQVLAYINTVKSVFVSYGEVFFSRYYLDLLFHDSHINKHVLIQTNGLLFDKFSDKLQQKFNSIDIYVSVDASTKETYARLRNDEFDKLYRNLFHIKNLKIKGFVKTFNISFVVQSENFREMAAFVDMAKELHCDTIYFTRFKNWRNFPEQTYITHDVFHPNNEFHEEFIEMINQLPFFDPIVNIQNHQQYVHCTTGDQNEI